jgi:hypothetical protein
MVNLFLKEVRDTDLITVLEQVRVEVYGYKTKNDRIGRVCGMHGLFQK